MCVYGLSSRLAGCANQQNTTGYTLHWAHVNHKKGNTIIEILDSHDDIKIRVVWNVTACGVVNGYRHFGGK
jgi:hypothetical protein